MIHTCRMHLTNSFRNTKNMRRLILLLSLLCCFQQTLGFDMWEAIENANKGVAPKNRTKTPFGGGPQHAESNIIQGDVVREVLAAPTVQRYALFGWHKKLWMKREIPYLITGSLRWADKKKNIKDSFNQISQKTCLSFREKRSSDKHWLEYYVGNGCFSGIGRRYFRDNLPQRISLGKNCVHPSIIIHETLHALGFPHEQSRYDRDSFVKIYEDRVLPSLRNNFEKNELYEINTEGTPYDYHSIMHYSKRSFARYPNGNTMEAKFDPNMKLGGSQLSRTDILEINRLYQCDVKKGWGKWSDWSPCLQQTWGNRDCTKAKVRICVSVDQTECPGVNEYGVQENVRNCSPSQCQADEKRRDGQWGNWGEFSKCSGSCGWGRAQRNRQCNNPIPVSGGLECVGTSKEYKLCRNPRCGTSFAEDNHFNTNSWGGWKSKHFTLKLTSRTGGWNGGPSRDHTSEVKGNTYRSFYASARYLAERNAKPDVMQLWSPMIRQPNGYKCLSFYYMLNGVDLHPTNALSLFLKFQNGEYLNLAFNVGGHQGNHWKRASLRIPPKKTPYQFVFEARFLLYRQSEVAIDDVFFDHNDCQKGLTGCVDERKDCQQLASKGLCNSNTDVRRMLGECCATCNQVKYQNIMPNQEKLAPICKDLNDNCYYWSKSKECQNSKSYMEKNCCASCNKSPTCKNKNTKCEEWSKKGECKKNVFWMLTNCCASCFKFDP